MYLNAPNFFISFSQATKVPPFLAAWTRSTLQSYKLPLGISISKIALIALSNLSAASWTFGFYTRLGNYVNYSGGFTVSINTGSLTTFGCHIDVPVNSAWSAQSFACNGSCICEYQSSGNNKSIAAYISNATDSDIRFTWYPVSAPDSPQTMNVQFNLMYKVI